MASHLKSPATQILYLEIHIEKDLNDTSNEVGRQWAKAIDIAEAQPGFRRAYWGRSPEEPEKVQLHIARDRLSQHDTFRYSSQYESFKQILDGMVLPSSDVVTRHALLTEQTPNCKSLGRGATFTGSAIYVSTNAAWHEGAWPLWTHIVRHVDGCQGCSGGLVLEPVDGHSNSYIVYVGWESIEKHEAYHHTKHFAKHRVVLGCGNKGYREYGHIVFDGSREKSNSRL